MRNFEVAWLFSELADRLEVIGENPFKVLAYRKAARSLEALPQPFEELYRQGTLTQIPGIGAAINTKIGEVLNEGRISLLARLREEIPMGVMEMLTIPGVGPRLANIFFRQLGITTVEELHEAARAHRLRDVKGLGTKAELNVLRGIEHLQHAPERLPYGLVLPIAMQLREGLSRLPEVLRVELAGSIRRGRDAVADVDILVATESPETVIGYFTGLPLVREVLSSGSTKASITHQSGIQVDLRVVALSEFGAAWQYFTGSKEHNVSLRERARKQGLKLSEYGLYHEDGEPSPLPDENDVYRLLGLQFIPPELREDRGEIEAAESGTLPSLIEAGDIRGDLHLHSRYSDGVASLGELADAAAARGYEYLAVCDHSHSLAIARGLDVERLAAQGIEVDEVNAQRRSVRLLKGTEADILSDGRLDFPDEVLAGLDVVVASIHSGFKQDPDQLWRRVESALKNEHVDILGHPSGRLIARREPYGLDLEAVLVLAAKTGTAVEINSSPDRLDLSDIWARRAAELGVTIAIDTDAHSLEQFDYMPLGVVTARRGWVTAEDVLNAKPLADLTEWLETPKSKRARLRSRTKRNASPVGADN